MTRWAERGACRDKDPDLFFPSNPGDLYTEARRLCDSCPVRQECLDEALRQRDTYAFRGGTTGEQRRQRLKDVPKPDVDAQIRRLRAKYWSVETVCRALGVTGYVVHRAMSTSREAS